MKVAVACEGMGVSHHAAQCASFMCYTVDKGIITDCRNLPNMGVTSHDAAQLVKDLGFDALIAGGIDMDMANELCYAGIEVVAGVEGTAREVAEAYISHTLMGATELCHAASQRSADPEDRDIDAAFDRIYRDLESAV
ncbi:NifB/NifX family molybdenum-iron cluster-binding protein [Adlercreutzia faecimuris]|uniref:Dinitrogenase iron-molybdenum cofactor biosynthesis domain-containing protein n=1 Tax=Adlercreutzia faecimuris TaxID=2897341 RepID=A0ABS9WIE3_9ACTN|nr:NifB/NifX family molybdenum-iron cluster-binding protein [Adlercreutzia sp. JBNU-10]MCI2242222.1 hypothetical protein [Adlercreutzia sp. JBNU-10]